MAFSGSNTFDYVEDKSVVSKEDNYLLTTTSLPALTEPNKAEVISVGFCVASQLN